MAKTILKPDPDDPEKIITEHDAAKTQQFLDYAKTHFTEDCYGFHKKKKWFFFG